MNISNHTLTADVLNASFISSAVPLIVLTIICAVLGTLGNVFVLYIHIFKYQQCTFRCFVLGLCAVDLSSSLIIVPLEVYNYMHWYIFTRAWLCEVKAFLNVFLSFCSVYILLLIAIDRYLKVCAPHRQQLTPVLVLKCYGMGLILACCQSWTILMVWGSETYTKMYEGELVEFSMCVAVQDNFVWRVIFKVTLIPSFIALASMVVIYVLVGKKIFGVLVNMKQQSTRKKTLRKMHRVHVNKANGQRVSDRASSQKETSATGSTFENQVRSELPDETLTAFSGNILIYKVNDDSIDVTEKTRPECLSQKDLFLQKRKYEERSSKLLLSRTSSAPTSSCHKLHVPDMASDIQGSKKYGSSPANVVSGGDRSESSESETMSTEHASDGQQNTAENQATKDGVETDNTANNDDAPVSDDVVRRKSIFTRRVMFKVSAREKLKRRTLITFIFTSIFIVTIVTNIVLHSRMTTLTGRTSLASHETALVAVAFFKLYFINYVIHPILYGILDPRFRKCIKQTSKQVVGSVIRGFDVPQAS